ncbi:MAG: SMI1/KNR4 family protein [Pirellula sp.]
MTKIGLLFEKIRSIANEHCESQMYYWPGFNHLDPNPKKFFRKLGIEFDGNLFIRYQVKKTFCPMTVDKIMEEESKIGVLLPTEYKALLAEFGGVHLPGNANIAIDTPKVALSATRDVWCYEGKPLSALAISPFHRNADGNSIGFIRAGSEFSPIVHEFDHELVYKGDDPSLWSRPLANTLSDFLLDYLDTK